MALATRMRMLSALPAHLEKHVLLNDYLTITTAFHATMVLVSVPRQRACGGSARALSANTLVAGVKGGFRLCPAARARLATSLAFSRIGSRVYRSHGRSESRGRTLPFCALLAPPRVQSVLGVCILPPG